MGTTGEDFDLPAAGIVRRRIESDEGKAIEWLAQDREGLGFEEIPKDRGIDLTEVHLEPGITAEEVFGGEAGGLAEQG